MNVYRITFEEWLNSTSEPHPNDLTSCGEDSAIVVANGDAFEAAQKFSKSRLHLDMTWTDEETGKKHKDFVAACDIHGIERLHQGVTVLK